MATTWSALGSSGPARRWCSPTTHGGSRSAREIDGKTLLTALAIEATNASCYTCVEVLLLEDVEHFERTKADELIVTGEVTSLLLASAATDHGMSRVIGDLLTRDPTRGPDNLVSMDLASSMVGKPFVDVLADVKRTSGATVVAIEAERGDLEVNPPSDRPLAAGDRLLVISGGLVDLRTTVP